MTKTSSLFLSTITLALLSACTSTPNQAPVSELHISRPPAQPTPAPAPKVEDKPGMYTVKKGDTLLRIALDHGQNYRDLVAWNNLSNPNDIKVDQVLRVEPPEERSGVQTASVAPPPSLTRAPAEPSAPKKTSPKADKQPYTDNNLADLQKNGNDKPEKADKPAEKPTQLASVAPSLPKPAAPALSTEDRAVSWQWPTDGKVVGSFDEGKNKGIDIAGRAGQQVVSAGAGKVMYAGSGIRGYGNLVIVKHSNGLLSAYAHNRSILVQEGQTVNKGQAIAEMGDSDTDSVKLHFEIRQQGKPVDPSKFLPNR
ncbi:peptidoglycan DD-metalloendopeptidase family protein [Massilia endophytica]|uniref:peptidoglycan DD-metalloendopeptidase family protein n=1 Tax=Massilia endophytica TaxID=2899220 RepID=UPI001E656964|nr:peptidoglycan DD-metalloendopeptidase family protein [Massilia endophytica]UGQ44892.1 peptidoglycan DD-metalloendopeptidase family protein [Massilia endophytica]